MGKSIVSVILFLAMWAAWAQEGKITMDLDAFKEVKVYDGLSVNLIRADRNMAIITGSSTDKVSVVNNEGVLKVRMEIGKIFSGYRTFVDIYYDSELVVLDVNEDARIQVQDVMEQEVLEIKAQEGGELEVSVQVEQLLVKSVTGGIVKATGRADLQDVMINTGGVYQGKDCRTKFSTVNVNAGSKAEIFATDYVKAVVKAGGEVLVYGEPKKVDEKTVFGGTITRM